MEKRKKEENIAYCLPLDLSSLSLLFKPSLAEGEETKETSLKEESLGIPEGKSYPISDLDRREWMLVSRKIDRLLASWKRHHPRETFFRAEITDFPCTSELISARLAVVVRYGKKAVQFPSCRMTLKLEPLIQRALWILRPHHLSCSWIPPQLSNYALQIGKYVEYVLDFSLPLCSLVYARTCVSRGESLEFKLVEKRSLDPVLCNLSSCRMEGETFEIFEAPASGIAQEISLEIPSSRISSSEMGGKEGQESSSESLPQVFLKKFLRLSLTGNCPLIPLPKGLFSGNVSVPGRIKSFSLHHLSEEILSQTGAFSLYRSFCHLCLILRISLRYGNETWEERTLDPVPYERPRWETEVVWEKPLASLPRETEIRFALEAQRRGDSAWEQFYTSWILLEPSDPVLLAWGGCSVFDLQGKMRTGIQKLPLWVVHSFSEVPWNEDSLPLTNPHPKAPLLVFSIAGAPEGVSIEYGETESPRPAFEGPIYVSEWKEVRQGRASSEVFWKCLPKIREKCPTRLVSYLRSLDWFDPVQRAEIHRALAIWPKLYPVVGLELWSLETPDEAVRRYAVQCLKRLSDSEVIEYIPQLVQTLQRDPSLDSPLMYFLLLRAFQSRRVGPFLYWYLNSAREDPLFRARGSRLQEAYLDSLSVKEQTQLLETQKLWEALACLAKQAKESSWGQIRRGLRALKIPSSFSLPTNPKVELRGLRIDRCFILKSNTRPLWLVFEDEKGQDVQVILKIGEDVRRDVLALQWMRILDALWKQEGLDLHLQPYVAMPLGNSIGLIEVVSKSETTANINWKFGGQALTSAFSTTSLRKFLRKYNPGLSARTRAIENFTRSCAGYCVFTYLFGVGDRHSDNILCSENGNLFHIDFAYFLGQKTKIWGIPRENPWFVLTQNYVNAMEGSFEKFVQWACEGFLLARKYEPLFTLLISLMRTGNASSVLPEDSVHYVRKMCEPWKSEEEARTTFLKVIQRSLEDKRSVLNDFAHMIKQQKI